MSAAFAATPREQFLPAQVRSHAAYDGPLDIGHGQTSSQPRTVDAMLRLLRVRPGDRVLDVGAGSGWTTALLAALTGADGRVLGVEVVPELVVFGAANLAAVRRPWATIRRAADEVLGLPEDAPFDRILVSAEAKELPAALVAQLAPGGRMVAPVAGRMLLVVRGVDEVEVTRHGHYRFVPLL
ncbi:MAG: protein-L-isoaspartate(D-aspartate) O-methyltransferase [Nocardioidaceae bacterium]|nr:protein-L-isoaspartate(D-aspartate) O-methyltransferase [Nocardioidaceae bacterium]